MDLIVLSIVGFFLGAMFLGLMFAYRGTEDERAALEGQASDASRSLAGPRFFANLPPVALAGAHSSPQAPLLDRVQEHVRREQMAVSGFVDQPSVDRLFPGYSAYVDTVSKQLERYIENEMVLAAGFVEQPSLAGFVGAASPIADASSKAAKAQLTEISSAIH
jgi:hypothetical protein